MKPIEQKIWRVAAHPILKVILVLCWPLGAFYGTLMIVKYDHFFRIAPIVSISSILCCFLGTLVVAIYFRSQIDSGGPYRSYLTLSQLSSVVCIAYFSASCITLFVSYRWTPWDNIRPHHWLPDPRLYPTADLAYLGLVLSVFLWAAVGWRKRTSRPL